MDVFVWTFGRSAGTLADLVTVAVMVTTLLFFFGWSHCIGRVFLK
jgi:hypothetical protein